MRFGPIIAKKKKQAEQITKFEVTRVASPSLKGSSAYESCSKKFIRGRLVTLKTKMEDKPTFPRQLPLHFFNQDLYCFTSRGKAESQDQIH